jgi:adenylate kinase family enzyme
MALFFVTGSSGSGKSHLTKELRGRGYDAYDTDDDALARWQHKQTGYIHPKSSVKAEMRTPEFLAVHDWNVPREYIEKIAESSHGKPVFILGVANNYDALSDLFARTLALHIDDDTMVQRLQTRTNNNWGKQPHELQQSLDAHQGAEERWRSDGYLIIDATQSLDRVVDDIINVVMRHDGK